MGLAERRAIKQAHDEVIPAAKTMIKNLSGADVAIELDVPSFEEHPKMMGSDFLWVLKHYAFESLETALQDICKDDMGKEAVKDGFKKITVKNVPTGTPRRISFSAGVFALEERFNLGEYYTSSEIQKVIEKGL
jgi:hypothetical protein